MHPLPLVLISALVLGSTQAAALEYDKFSSDALLVMRSAVPEEDREAYRSAFLQRIEEMDVDARKVFREQAMAHMANLNKADRQEMMSDLMQHMQSMSPDQLAALGQRFSKPVEVARTAPQTFVRQALPRVQKRMPVMPMVRQYQPRWQPAPGYAYPQRNWGMQQPMQAYAPMYGPVHGPAYVMPQGRQIWPAYGYPNTYPGYR